ncbi:Far upstream element-binding protein 3 [Galemys pyrenaicus]|uniref:Far upstream element-binding protein 3 n=1 Tax=Galemys pyrenaicus TaxID=202257 RepID=A0A8J6A6T5_GALPY|nr:Far upstream element-binding protein 3 [Galemys pyrenaicus]
MAELVQGQSAPVGMKAEGFVDALHRVRQVRARPAGGSTSARGGAGPGLMGRRGRAWGGRQPGLTSRLGGGSLDAPAPGRSRGMRRHREAQAQTVVRVSQVLAAAGKAFAQDAYPPRAPALGLDLQGSQPVARRFARRAHRQDPGTDGRRSQVL